LAGCDIGGRLGEVGGGDHVAHHHQHVDRGAAPVDPGDAVGEGGVGGTFGRGGHDDRVEA